MGVVDHAGLAGAPDVTEGVGEEDLAGEAVESGVHLEEQHPGVTEDEARGLDLSQVACETKTMRGGIVLHLGPGLEVIVPSGESGGRADAVLAAKRGERLVGETGALSEKLFVHPYEVARTVGVKLENLVMEGLSFLGAREKRDLTGAAL
jgi:hypothetical protein